MLSQVFNLRIKALKWLSEDSNFNYSKIFQDVLQQIEKLKSNRNFEVLIENIHFALRCNERLIKSILNSNEFYSETLSSKLTELPEITYSQFIASIAYANLDDEITQKIVDWTNASLHIEFVIVAADIINDEKIKISDKTINELALLIADAAQEYSALAIELGVVKSPSKQQSLSNFNFDNNFIREEKLLADAGLNEFAVNV